MTTSTATAPGAPGATPTWTSSAKDGVGTSISEKSKVWFTLSHGILNEVYYPTIDCPAIRDSELIVTDGSRFFSEEKRDCQHTLTEGCRGIPAYEIVNTDTQSRYSVSKTVFTDPARDVLLQSVCFKPLNGHISDYHVYLITAPHLDSAGAGNEAWTGEFNGRPLLFARRKDTVMAIGCTSPWRARSVGYVGVSDGWQILKRNGNLSEIYEHAANGDVAVTGEIDLAACDGRFVVAIGFGETPDQAGQKVIDSLNNDIDNSLEAYKEQWSRFQSNCMDPGEAGDKEDDCRANLYRVSTSVLKTHESKRFPGGIIASLSFPWGSSRGDHDNGGYHVVWPRDQVEAATALLAAGHTEQARHTLDYLMKTQSTDGHWAQNMWLDGTTILKGLQTDETAFFIFLVDLLRRENAIEETGSYWDSIKKAAAFLIRTGPATQQDRWEENSGYSVYTLAILISALLSAADLADQNGEMNLGSYFRQTADSWNDQIDRWTYVRGTPLAKQCDVDGYYVRLTPRPENQLDVDPQTTEITLKNKPQQQANYPVWKIVSPDALALVRFGLRSPNDPRILNTIKVLDSCLRTETATGPVWHRYSYDGYGEHADGAPFDTVGIGRGWPLLVGERAHYEISAGNYHQANDLMTTMSRQTSLGGMIPEQVWDTNDIPEKELFSGRPSGSGMPLVWAHAEYIKLVRSMRDQKIFGCPPQTVDRYLQHKISSEYAVWRSDYQIGHAQKGKKLRIEANSPFTLHWGQNEWQNVKDIDSVDTGIGIHIADIESNKLQAGADVQFTFFWHTSSSWEGQDYTVSLSG